MTHSIKAFSSNTISPLGNYPFIPAAVTTGKKQQACILPRHCVLPPTQDSLENNKITYLQNQETKNQQYSSAYSKSSNTTSANFLLSIKAASTAKLPQDDQSVFLRTFSRGTHRRRLTQRNGNSPHSTADKNAILPTTLFQRSYTKNSPNNDLYETSNPNPSHKSGEFDQLFNPTESSTLPKMIFAGVEINPQETKVASVLARVPSQDSMTTDDYNWQPDSTPVKFNQIQLAPVKHLSNTTVNISNFLEAQKLTQKPLLPLLNYNNYNEQITGGSVNMHDHSSSSGHQIVGFHKSVVKLPSDLNSVLSTPMNQQCMIDAGREDYSPDRPGGFSPQKPRETQTFLWTKTTMLESIQRRDAEFSSNMRNHYKQKEKFKTRQEQPLLHPLEESKNGDMMPLLQQRMLQQPMSRGWNQRRNMAASDLMNKRDAVQKRQIGTTQTGRQPSVPPVEINTENLVKPAFTSKNKSRGTPQSMFDKTLQASIGGKGVKFALDQLKLERKKTFASDHAGSKSVTPNRKRLGTLIHSENLNQKKRLTSKHNSSMVVENAQKTTTYDSNVWKREQTRRIMIYKQSSIDSQSGQPNLNSPITPAYRPRKTKRGGVTKISMTKANMGETDRWNALRSTGTTLHGQTKAGGLDAMRQRQENIQTNE